MNIYTSVHHCVATMEISMTSTYKFRAQYENLNDIDKNVSWNIKNFERNAKHINEFDMHILMKTTRDFNEIDM